jgi:hypothetical protein
MDTLFSSIFILLIHITLTYMVSQDFVSVRGTDYALLRSPDQYIYRRLTKSFNLDA